MENMKQQFPPIQQLLSTITQYRLGEGSGEAKYFWAYKGEKIIIIKKRNSMGFESKLSYIKVYLMPNISFFIYFIQFKILFIYFYYLHKFVVIYKNNFINYL